jgi:hypothetical protein
MSRHEPDIRIRSATRDDLDILWDFLAIAAYEPDPSAGKTVPFVAAHRAVEPTLAVAYFFCA